MKISSKQNTSTNDPANPSPDNANEAAAAYQVIQMFQPDEKVKLIPSTIQSNLATIQKVSSVPDLIQDLPDPTKTSPITLRQDDTSSNDQSMKVLKTTPPTPKSKNQASTSTQLQAIPSKLASTDEAQKIETKEKPIVKSPSGIKAWAEDDRPREKLLQKGMSAITNAELLAILLRSGSKDRSAVDLGKDILALANNNLSNLGKLDHSDYTKVLGVGPAKAITIAAAMELGRRRQLVSREEMPALVSSSDTYNYIGPTLSDLPHEEFWVIYLTTKCQIIKKKQFSKGSTKAVLVDNSMILREALLCKAYFMILVHNHPSGQLRPSKQDINITNRLKESAKMMDLDVCDHMIIGDQSYYSFRDEGMV